MKNSYLNTLIEVVENKSYSVAAKKLFLTQPAISKHIKMLEKHYKINIFTRESRDIQLTTEGEMLYAYALNIKVLNENLNKKLTDEKGGARGELNIHSSNIPGNVYLSKAIPSFLKKYPNVEPTIIVSDTLEVIKKVESGQVPYGLVGKKFENTNIQCTELFENDMVVVAPKIYQNRLVDEKLLTNLKIVTREKGSATREVFINYLTEKGISKEKIKTAIYCNDNNTLIHLLSHGDYIAYVSKNLIEDNNNVAILETIKKRKFYFIENTNRYLSSAELAFKDYIINR